MKGKSAARTATAFRIFVIVSTVVKQRVDDSRRVRVNKPEGERSTELETFQTSKIREKDETVGVNI